MNSALSISHLGVRPRSRAWPAELVLRLLVAAGLGVDAGIHIHLAPVEPPGASGQVSEVTLFYAEAAVSIAAGVLILLTGARLAFFVAALVAGSALGAVLLYRYVDVGSLGPLPDMYEPFWYATKTATAVAEGVAFVAAAAGFLLPRRR